MVLLNLKTAIFSILLLVGFNVKAQYFVQLVSETDHGETDSVGVNVIFRNSDSNIVFAGNERINATQCNFKTLCSDPDAVLDWAQSFNVNLQKAYTTASTHDNQGYIYIAGCTYIDATNNQDLTVMKYDPDGNLIWATHHNGTGSFIDVASDLIVDPNTGDIYVTGASFNNSMPPSLDMITLRLNSAGQILWTQSYDFANNMDVATGIALDAAGTNIIISGSSGTTSSDWEFATLSYDAITGSTIAVNRTTNTVVAQDKELAMTTDASGNIFFTGMVSNGNNDDIKICKMDATLNVLWDHSVDGHGRDDGGYDIQVDNSMNVYVSGFSKTGTNAQELVVLKYSPNGTLRWKRTQQSSASSSAQGFKIKIKNDNEIYVGGNELTGGNQDAMLLKYDSLGNNRMYKTYDSGSNWDWCMDLEISENNIYMSSRSKIAGNYRNILLHYKELSVEPVFTTISPIYERSELIISFNPSIMKMQTINDRELIFGKLLDFIPDTTCAKIDMALRGWDIFVPSMNFAARKIFSDVTANDSLSVSRLGDVVKVPKFWASIVVTIPAPSPQSLPSISGALNAIKPDIFYSNLNWAYTLSNPPNDFQYHGQSSIHSTTFFPNAHINVDSAWVITDGKPSVKVGVFDSGVEGWHNDLAGINHSGFDYYSNVPSYGGDTENHGTCVAGIIGATKNNGINIAGIAGGNNGAGAQIVDLRIVENWAPVPASRILQAIHRGVRATSDSVGYAVNIMNYSFNTEGSSYNNSWKDELFQELLVFATRNGVAISASKGQIGNGMKIAQYPGDWNPEIVTCVGGSGTDGEFCAPALGNCVMGASNWGHNVDFVAPASGTTIISTGVGHASDLFGYTSAAAAHVSGAYALMMSYYNGLTSQWDNLVHEDCENIIKRKCTDLTNPTYTTTVGYDSVSGFGRVNVYQALKSIDRNFYRLRHLNYNHNSAYSSSSSLLSTSILAWPAYKSLAAGNYNTEVHEVTTQVTYTLEPNEQIIDYWPMYKECFGWSDVTSPISIDKPYFTKIVSVAGNVATLKTYVFKNLSNNIFYPITLTNAKSAITLYTYDSTGTGLNVNLKNNDLVNRNFNIKPNPNNGEFDLTFGSQVSTNMTYRIFDVLGKEVKSGTYRSEFGVNNIHLNISGLTNGVYIINLFDEQKTVYRQKVIKN